MSKELNDALDQAIDGIKEMIEKIRKVSKAHKKIDEMIADFPFDVKMSIISMSLSKAIIDEADDVNEAMSYVARLSHSLVEVIDKHIEAEKNAEGGEEEDDDKDGPVH